MQAPKRLFLVNRLKIDSVSMLDDFWIRVSAKLIKQVKKLSFAAKLPGDFDNLICFKNLQRVAALIITGADLAFVPMKLETYSLRPIPGHSKNDGNGERNPLRSRFILVLRYVVISVNLNKDDTCTDSLYRKAPGSIFSSRLEAWQCFLI